MKLEACTKDNIAAGDLVILRNSSRDSQYVHHPALVGLTGHIFRVKALIDNDCVQIGTNPRDRWLPHDGWNLSRFDKVVAFGPEDAGHIVLHDRQSAEDWEDNSLGSVGPNRIGQPILTVEPQNPGSSKTTRGDERHIFCKIGVGINTSNWYLRGSDVRVLNYTTMEDYLKNKGATTMSDQPQTKPVADGDSVGSILMNGFKDGVKMGGAMSAQDAMNSLVKKAAITFGLPEETIAQLFGNEMLVEFLNVFTAGGLVVVSHSFPEAVPQSKLVGAFAARAYTGRITETTHKYGTQIQQFLTAIVPEMAALAKAGAFMLSEDAPNFGIGAGSRETEKSAAAK